MTSSKRHGQAALEYMVTYGWGFLAILVAVGALAYFGIFDVNKYLPEHCSFGVQLECADHQMRAPNTVSLGLRNNFGETVNVTRVWANGALPASVAASGDGVSFIATANPITITAGNITYVQLNFTSLALAGNERMTVPLIIEFQRNAAGSPLHNITGEIFATVVA